MNADALDLRQQLLNAASELKVCVTAYQLAALKKIQAKEALQSWFVVAFAEGMIAGRNEAEREGNARLIRHDLFDAEQKAIELEAQTKMNLELARIEWRRVLATIELVVQTARIYSVNSEPFENGWEVAND